MCPSRVARHAPGHVPELHDPVAAAGGDRRTVGGDGDRANEARRAFQGTKRSLTLQSPRLTGPPAVASERPSGVKARTRASLGTTASKSSSRLVAVSQSFSVSEPESSGSVARILPSGERAMRVAGC